MLDFHRLGRDLSHEIDEGRLTEYEAGVKVTSAMQAALNCAHVSIWVVRGEPSQRVMRRFVGYDGVKRIAVDTPVEFTEANGVYFGALVGSGCYVCSDTLADPNLAPVADTVLVPFHIRSLMSAAYGSNGETWGIITCTDTTVRKWLSWPPE